MDEHNEQHIFTREEAQQLREAMERAQALGAVAVISMKSKAIASKIEDHHVKVGKLLAYVEAVRSAWTDVETALRLMTDDGDGHTALPSAPCPETGKPHRFGHDEEYDAGSGTETINCEDCGEPAPEGWEPGEGE